MEHLAGETVQARQLRDRRLGDGAAGVDEHVGGQRSGAGLDPPALRGVVPGGLDQAAAEADVRQQPVLAGDPAQVVADLGLPGEGPGPVRVGREGQRVQVRRDVAGAARIGVVPPDAADLQLALQHGEVLAPAFEGVGRGQPAEPGADNDDAEMLRHGFSDHGELL